MRRLPRLLSFDVETAPADNLPLTDDPKGYALEPCRLRSRQAQILSASFAGDSRMDATVGFYKPSRDTLTAILKGAIETNTVIVAWNSTFDVAWLLAMGLKDLVFKVKWLDGMLIRRHAHNQITRFLGHSDPTLGLKACVNELAPGCGDYGKLLDPFIGDMRQVAAGQVITYNKLDAMWTYKLAQHWWGHLSDQQRELTKLEGLSIPMFAEANLEGFDVNRAKAQEIDRAAQADISVALVSMSMLAQRPITSATVGSPDQLGEVLLSLGVPLKKKTKTGKPATDADTLAPLMKDYPIVEHALKWRRAHKTRSTYVEPVLASSSYNPDGRTRPNARMFGTYTGRLTFYSDNSVREPGKRQGTTRKAKVQTGIPIHQWPRDPAIRSILVAPPGFTIIEADFKGQEFRWMAEYSRDTTMIHYCGPDIDAHVAMGGSIGKVGYNDLLVQLASKDPDIKTRAKTIRQLGKVGNLACQYRIGVDTLRDRAESDYGVVLTSGEASHIRETYRRTYPAVPRYWRRAIAQFFADGHITTFGGRRIHPPEGELAKASRITNAEFGSEPSNKRYQLEQSAINGPIQGSGADQKYLALAFVRDYILGIGGRLWMDLHDGLFFLVPDARARQAADTVHEMLSNLPYRQVWGRQPVIDFPVEVKMGKVWGELQVVWE